MTTYRADYSDATTRRMPLARAVPGTSPFYGRLQTARQFTEHSTPARNAFLAHRRFPPYYTRLPARDMLRPTPAFCSPCLPTSAWTLRDSSPCLPGLRVSHTNAISSLPWLPFHSPRFGTSDDVTAGGRERGTFLQTGRTLPSFTAHSCPGEPRHASTATLVAHLPLARYTGGGEPAASVGATVSSGRLLMVAAGDMPKRLPSDSCGMCPSFFTSLRGTIYRLRCNQSHT